MSHNMSLGQKCARLDKEYLPSDWTSNANISMADIQGDDLSARKRILKIGFFDQVMTC